MKIKGNKKFNLRDYNELIDLSDYEMTIKQAVMAKCKECCGFSSKEAILCNAKDCALHKLYQRYVRKSVTKIKKDTNNSI